MHLIGVFAMPDTRRQWNWNVEVEFIDFEADWKRDRAYQTWVKCFVRGRVLEARRRKETAEQAAGADLPCRGGDRRKRSYG